MKKNGNYPSKITLNLAKRERSDFSLLRLLPRLLVVAIIVVLFAKFAVMDRLEEVAFEQAALNETQRQVEMLESSLTDYEEVAAQYARYSTGWMTDTEKALVDRRTAMALVEDVLMPNADVLELSVAENVVSANLAGITLGEASALVKQLNTSDVVYNVEVFTATNQEQPDAQVIISMVITLWDAGSEAIG